MTFDNPDSNLRLTRRSLLLSSASAAALFALPASRFGVVLAAQSPAATSSTFLDGAVVHDVVATFDQDEYDAVIAAYQESGDKQWLKAMVAIDGQTFDEVGLRLKGNSSLMGLRSNGDNGTAFGGDGPQLITVTDGTPTAQDNVQTDQAQPAQGDRAVVVGPGGNISADEPEGLPWLVRLDKYIDGQNLNGLSEFVIRSNNSATALNEALSLELLAEAGLASQAAAYIRFTANDSDPRLRIAIENPDDAWLEAHFPNSGTLFKSEADGNWTYKDDDLDAYMQAFDLEAGGGDDDADNYAPLISFLDFVNNADDAAFTSELPDRLDVDQFAVYLAMMDVIQNDDDIDGPGNNSYLFYDESTGIFTVVPWDMNLAFGPMGGFGSTRGGGGGQFPAGDSQLPDGAEIQDGQLVIDGTPVAGQLPVAIDGDGTPVAGVDGGPTYSGPGDRTTGNRGPGGMNNPLTQRWAGVDAFTTLQADAKTKLTADLFASGQASQILARWVEVLETQATDVIDRSTIDSESRSLQEIIDAV